MNIKREYKKLFSSFLIILSVFILSSCFNDKDKPVIKEHEIVYMVDDSTMKTEIYKSGDKITLPDAPEKTDLTFMGWFLGQGVNDQQVFNNQYVLDSMTLFARYKTETEISVPMNKTVPIFQGVSFESKEIQAKRGLPILSSIGAFDDQIKDQIDIIESTYVEHFSQPSETLRLQVQLYNPDNFVILRFTLNGVVYQSYQFLEGSTSEKLILEVKAPNTSGVHEFSVDEIKYIDDTSNNEIKDVIIDGKKTISLGVAYQSLPKATLSAITTFDQSASMAINLSAVSGLVTSSTYLFVFDGNEIVKTQTLNTNTNIVQIEGLKPNKDYEYKVVTSFDLLDSNGALVHTLLEGTFKTKSTINLSNISSTTNTISFNIVENNLVNQIRRIDLIKDNDVIETLTSFNQLMFESLNSNSTYIIRLYYSIQDNSEHFVEYTVTTKAKTVPSVDIFKTSMTTDLITYEISYKDPFGVSNSVEVHLLVDGQLIASSESFNSSFTELLSGKSYVLRIINRYDMNDGLGEKELVTEKSIQTVSKITPETGLTIQPLEEGFTYDLITVDPNGIYQFTGIYIYHEDLLVKQIIDEENRLIEGLSSNTLYELKYRYTYDLNDGKGIQSKEVIISVQTLKQKPTIEIVANEIGSNEVRFDILENDLNNVGTIKVIELMKDGKVAVNLTNLSIREFSGLISDSNYVIRVTYGYDLEDGMGSQNLQKEIGFKTIKQAPSLELSREAISNEGFELGLLATDINGAGEVEKIELYRGLELLETRTSTADLVYSGLWSNRSYTVKVTYAYDLLDGQGTQRLVETISITTLENTKPTIEIKADRVSEESILASYNVINESYLKAVVSAKLYENQVFLVEGLVDDIEFNNLKSNTSYRLELSYQYDLNDSKGLITEKVSQVITTSAYDVPVVGVNVTSLSEGLSYSYVTDDNNNLIMSVENKLYKDGVLSAQASGLETGSYEGLLPNTSYEIRVTYKYDLNDGKGVQTVNQNIIATTSRQMPTINLSVLSMSQTSMSFDLYVTDINTVGQLTGIRLYRGNQLIKNLTNFSIREFTELQSNTEYSLIAYYTYDLDNGRGSQVLEKSITFRTLKTMPSLSLSNIIPTQDEVSFNIVSVDKDGSGKLTLVELINNGVVVDMLDDLNHRTFYDLLSDTNYTIRATYTYNLNDGLNDQSMTVSESFKTSAKATPTIESSVVETFKESMTFNVSVFDLDQVGYISSIVVLKDQQIYQSLDDINLRSIDDLLSNNQYQLRVTYTYDLNDGRGIRTISSVNSFVTLRKETPIISNVQLESDYTSINFTHELLDNENVTSFVRYDLLKNNEVIKSSTDLNKQSFGDLLTNNLYEVRIVYSYDLNDGFGSQTLSVKQSINTKAFNAPMVEVLNVFPDYHFVTFDFNVVDIDQMGTFVSFELVKDNQVIETVDDINQMRFDELLANNLYTIRVNYSYDLNDGQGVRTSTGYYTFRTLEKYIPGFNLTNQEITQTSLGFDVEAVSNEQLVSIDKVSLYKDNLLIQQALESKQVFFDNLLSNNGYMVTVDFTYNLDDGKGNQKSTQSYVLYTLRKETPIVMFDEVNPSSDLVSLSLDISDIDQVLSLSYADLYEGNVFVKRVETFDPIVFEQLKVDQNYTVKLTYSYDLNDGNGIITNTITKDVYTLPFIDVVSTKVINTSKVTEGDSIVIEMSINNPSKVIFTDVIINGQNYEVSNVSTYTYLRVEFIVDDTYTGGLTDFVVEEIVGLRGTEERNFIVTDNNVGQAFINGDITVDSIVINDLEGNELDTVERGQTYDVIIKFNNPTSYEITEITVSGIGTITSEYFSIDETNEYITIRQISNSSNTTLHFSLTGFKYNVDGGIKEKAVNQINTFVVAVIEKRVREIHTIEDLQNIRSGYSYILMNDISLDNQIWKSIDLNYVYLDGNGYSINDYRFVETIVDRSVEAGLFKNINNSIVKNLSVSNALIMVTVNNSTTESSYEIHAGLLAAKTHRSKFENINIEGEISLNNTTRGSDHLGGLVGYSNSSSYIDIYVDVVLVSGSYAGGLIGYTTYDTVERTYTEGYIYDNKSYAGGIVGYGYGLSISDAYSKINFLENNNSVGGIAGYISDSTILNTYYSGISDNYAHAILSEGWNNIYRFNFGSMFITSNNQYARLFNNPSTDSNQDNYNIGHDNYAQTLSVEDIILTIKSKWSSDIWRFGQGMPTLKWEPKLRVSNVLVNDYDLSFELDLVGFGVLGQIDSVSIYQNNVLISETNNFDLVVFDSLMYNTLYEVIIRYSYDYQDGSGLNEVEHRFELRTLPIEGTPEVIYNEVRSSHDSIEFDITYSDNLEVGDIISYRLVDINNQIVQEVMPSEELKFTDLLEKTVYYIETTVSYDMNDGFGKQNIVFRKQVSTNPTVLFTESSILNPGGVIVGNTVVFQMNVDNSIGVTFTKAIINGRSFDVAVTNDNQIRIDFKVDESFGLGDIDFIVEELVGTYENQTYRYHLAENNFVSSYLNGLLLITEIRFLDQQGNERDFVFRNETITIEVHLDNPTQYDITSIRYYNAQGERNAHNLRLSEDNQIVQFDVQVYVYNEFYFYIYSFDYNNSYVGSRTINIQSQAIYLPVLSQPNIIEIYTVEDLKSVTSYNHYVLMNDLDLGSENWQPLSEFRGIFDGNHHTISNLTSFDTFSASAKFGLFERLDSATIKNLYITDVNAILSVVGENNVDIYVGGLSGQINNSTLSNVEVTGNIDVNHLYNGSTYVGLVSGTLNASLVNGISVNGSVNGKTYTGGIFGQVQSSKLSNLYANVIVKGNVGTGLITGYIYYSKIDSVVSTGKNISESGSIGSITGISDNNSYTNVYAMGVDKNNNALQSIMNQSNIPNVDRAYSLAYESYFTRVTSSEMMTLMKSNLDPSLWYLGVTTVELKDIPSIDIRNISTNQYDVSFDLVEIDQKELGEIVSIEVYHKGVLWTSLEDLSLRTIEGLKYSEDYELRVTYAYDFSDGYGETVIVEKATFRTKDMENIPTVEIINVSSTVDSVTFDLAITSEVAGSYISHIGLYDLNGNLVDELLVNEAYDFNGLYSNSQYIIKVIYIYNYNDGFGDNQLEKKIILSTLSKELPSLQYHTVGYASSDEISINLNINDVDATLVETRVKLYDKGVLQKTLFNQENYIFNDLLSNHTYQYSIEYDYDLGDSNGLKTFVYGYYDAKTGTKTLPEPVMRIIDPKSDQVTINPILLNDYESIGIIQTLELYKDLILIQSKSYLGEPVVFSGLDPFTTYKIRMIYQVDKNEGYKPEIKTYYTEVTTNSSIELESVSILNPGGIVVGNTLLYQINLVNSENIEFVSGVINGKEYPVELHSNNLLNISFVVDESFGVGEVDFVIESLSGLDNNNLYTYSFNSNNSVTKVINGLLSLDEIRILDHQGYEKDFVTMGEGLTIELHISNPNDFDISQISYTLSFNKVTINDFRVYDDKTRIQFDVITDNSVNFYIVINKIIYSNDYIVNRTLESNLRVNLPSIYPSSIREVYTIEELQKIESNYEYVLMADLDLSGINWSGINNFRGVFDGNNHTISNLTTYESYDVNTNLGLFNNLTYATIKNLKLTSVNLVVNSSSSSSLTFNVGGLVGNASYSTIENIKIEGNIDGSYNMTGTNVVGLLVGNLSNSNVYDINVVGTVRGKSVVGGLAGNIRSSNVDNIFVDVSVSSVSEYIGVLSGRVNTSNIDSIYARGTVKTTVMYNSGLLIGYLENINKLTNVFSDVIPQDLYTYKTIGQDSLDNRYVNSYSTSYSTSGFTQVTQTELMTLMKSNLDPSLWYLGVTTMELKDIPSIDIRNISTNQYDVSFDLVEIDHKEVGEIVSIEVYHKGVLWTSLEDLNLRTIDGLKYSEDYELSVTYAYDFSDGYGETVIVEKATFRTKDMENIPAVEIINVSSTVDSVTFDLAITSEVAGSYISHIGLYDLNGNLISDIEPTGVWYVDGLYSSYGYEIRVIYIYNYNDGFGDNEVTSDRIIYTQTKQTPTITRSSSATTDTIKAMITSIADESTVLDTNIYLYLDGTLVSSALGVREYTFTNLYSNKQYKIKYDVLYDLNDTQGEKITTYYSDRNTLTKVIPTAKINVVDSGLDFVVVRPSLVDPDKIGVITKVELFDQGVLKQTAIYTGVDIRFEGLSTFTQYQVKLSYYYNLNENKGNVYQTYQSNVSTNPDFTVNSFVYKNIGEMITNETLFTEIDILNPQGITISQAVINGEYYNVSMLSTTKLSVDVNLSESFGGGLTTVTLDQLIGNKDGIDFVFNIETETQFEIFINGPIFTQSMELLDENGNKLTYNAVGDVLYVKVNFYNPTNYTISSIEYNTVRGTFTVSSSELTQSADMQSVTFMTNSYYYNNERDYVNIIRFNYQNDRIDNRTRISTRLIETYTLVTSEEVRYISTASELQQMESKYVYKLANDIDLDGINWTPIRSFNGVFDGNGFTISNLSITRTYEDETTYVGLFGQLNYAVITNLTITNSDIRVKVISNGGGSLSSYVGILSGQVQDSYFDNVKVSGNVSLNNATSGENYVGSLIGYLGGQNRIFNTNVMTRIESLNQNTYVGGFIGYAERAYYTVVNKAIIKAELVGKSNTSGFSTSLGENMNISEITMDITMNADGSLAAFANHSYQYLMINQVQLNLTLESSTYIYFIKGNDTIVGSSISNIRINLIEFSEEVEKFNLFSYLSNSKISNIVLDTRSTNTHIYSYSISNGSTVNSIYVLTNGTISNQVNFSSPDSTSSIDHIYSTSGGTNQTKASNEEMIESMKEYFDSSIWDLTNETELPKLK